MEKLLKILETNRVRNGEREREREREGLVENLNDPKIIEGKSS